MPPRRPIAAGKRVNLIVYMVELLMDPEDLGWRYTADPIPNLRALWRSCTAGNCIVPGQFSGSSDSEFEALTGMTMSFLPDRSLPYRQFFEKPHSVAAGRLEAPGVPDVRSAGGPEGIL